MAVTLALLAATAFALGTVLQQKGALETSADDHDPRFLVQILRRPVWLAGAGLLGLGWVLQAVALAHGSLEVVQSITSLSLVIALPFGAWLTGQQITRRVWHGAAAMVAGITLFVVANGGEHSSSHAPSADWWATVCVSLAAIGALVALGLRRRGAARALLFGSAAGVAFGAQAALTKVFVPLVSQGLGTVLTSWVTYALLGTALVGFATQQGALKTGALAPAMASSTSVTLFVSILLGAALFGEPVAKQGLWVLASIAGLGLAVVGVWALAGSAPPPAPSAGGPSLGAGRAPPLGG
jgi:drug/metabolite transporter (DMT)-like permease